jgi:hypothetical protein
MEPFFYWYMAAWIAACGVALALYLAGRRAYAISHRDYWRFLGEPWKLATFAIAITGITLIAPYTGDPTWDHVDGFSMSALTFATAPWAVGVMYQAIRGRAQMKEVYVAACAWMFSASWSYDLYLVLRDGDYPGTWLPNIFASSVLYASAGLMWNLEWQAGRGVIFAFMRTGWPSPAADSHFWRLAGFALPFMLFAVAAVLYFFVPSEWL